MTVYGAGEGKDVPASVQMRALSSFAGLGGGVYKRREEFWTQPKKAEIYADRGLAVKIGEIVEQTLEIKDKSLEEDSE